MKFLIIFVIFLVTIYGKDMVQKKWQKGESLITFLNKHNISKDIYFNLSRTDQELCSEIVSGIDYDIAYNNGVIEDILITISEDIQIHIYKDDDKYILKIIPIIYEEYTTILILDIVNSPYEDILLTTKNYKLAFEFVRNFKKVFNFRTLQPHDKIAIKYKQKVRLGQYYGVPTIIAATIQGRYRKKYIYKNPKDGRYYDKKGKSLASIFFKIPVSYTRISSKFTRKRFHPIKKRYIAHLGIDYAAPKGRKIRATAPGRVIFKARRGGYGKTIIIQHKGGYRSLYAHQSRFSSYIKKGSYVKQGQLIGYVGSTGLSTGAHLHFGLYKNGRAINPRRVMSYSKTTLYGKKRREFLSYAKKLKTELITSIENNSSIVKIEPFKSSGELNITKKDL